MLDDLKDLAGEGDGDLIRLWRIEIVSIDTLAALPPLPNDTLQYPQLWMNVSLRAHIEQSQWLADTQVPQLHMLRSMSAGSVGMRLRDVLSGARPGALNGIWLGTTAKTSVHLSVTLPCLASNSKAATYDRDCLQSAGTWGQSWTTLISLFVSLSWVACGASLSVHLLGSRLSDIRDGAYWHTLAWRVVLSCISRLLLSTGLIVCMFASKLSYPAASLVACAALGIVARAILMGCFNIDVGGQSLQLAGMR